MNFSLLTENVLAYSLQMGILVLAGGALPKLFRMRVPCGSGTGMPCWPSAFCFPFFNRGSRWPGRRREHSFPGRCAAKEREVRPEMPAAVLRLERLFWGFSPRGPRFGLYGLVRDYSGSAVTGARRELSTRSLRRWQKCNRTPGLGRRFTSRVR